MFVTSKRRKCCNDPDIFCYICGCFTLPPQRRNINSFIKKIYLTYFELPLGDQNKSWAPHQVCTTCVKTLRSWSQGKNAKLKFGVPMVWREPKNHVDDCYFCLVNVKGFNKKNKQHLQYPNIHSAIRPIPHSDKVPIPIFSKLPSQHARAGPLRVKCGQCGLVRASQNRKGPVQVRCSFHEGKVQFSSGLSSIANVYRNRAVPVQFGK